MREHHITKLGKKSSTQRTYINVLIIKIVQDSTIADFDEQKPCSTLSL